MSGDDYALNTSIEEHFDSSKYQPFISVNKAVKLTQDYMDEIKAMAQDAQPTDQNGNPIILSST